MTLKFRISRFSDNTNIAKKNFLEEHQRIYGSIFPSMSIWFNDLEITYEMVYRRQEHDYSDQN